MEEECLYDYGTNLTGFEMLPSLLMICAILGKTLAAKPAKTQSLEVGIRPYSGVEIWSVITWVFNRKVLLCYSIEENTINLSSFVCF